MVGVANYFSSPLITKQLAFFSPINANPQINQRGGFSAKRKSAKKGNLQVR
jgi:hypothetical protein